MGESASSVQTALSTALGNLQTEATSTMTTILPYALAVVILGISITLGIKWIKRITNKA